MSATTTRVADYAARFEAANGEVIALIRGCTDEQFQQPCVNEERPVGVVAHHVALVNGAFARIVEKLAAGEIYSPTMSWAEIDRGNAQHARDHAAVGKQETLDALRANGDAVAQGLRSLRDDQLERVAGTFGDRELTVAQVVEYVVIGHTAEHLASIRATLTV